MSLSGLLSIDFLEDKLYNKREIPDKKDY